MFQVVSNLGWLIRIAVALGFAAFWGYWAYQWHQMGEYGPGKPTVIGVGILAAIAGMSGLVGLVRMVTGTAKSVKLPERTPPQSDVTAPADFDPDAVMARYLAQREAGSAVGPGESSTPPAPQRPQFGRKQV